MKLRIITFYLWLILITVGIITYQFFPDKLSFSFMEQTAGNYHITTLVIYYLILSFQGVVFMPSPLIFVGVLIFNPIELFLVNMAGVMTSATIVYYFSKYLKFDIYFETKYSKYTHIIRAKLMDKEFPIIVGWSFFPLTPTNLVIYVGSTLCISVFKCLLGVFIGESIINAFYIITATMLFKGSLL
jgi:uncharacterized membrane protein YdjX (TVP38/TMEM64 family)